MFTNLGIRSAAELCANSEIPLSRIVEVDEWIAHEIVGNTSTSDPLERFSWFLANAPTAAVGGGGDSSCGIGPGGFQPGNTCAKGGAGGTKFTSDTAHSHILDLKTKPPPSDLATAKKDLASKLASDLKGTELKELMGKLGIKGSGTKAVLSEKLAGQVFGGVPAKAGGKVSGASAAAGAGSSVKMKVADAHSLIQGMMASPPADKGAAIKDLASKLVAGLTGDQMKELKEKLGFKGSGAKAAFAQKLAEQAFAGGAASSKPTTTKTSKAPAVPKAKVSAKAKISSASAIDHIKGIIDAKAGLSTEQADDVKANLKGFTKAQIADIANAAMPYGVSNYAAKYYKKDALINHVVQKLATKSEPPKVYTPPKPGFGPSSYGSQQAGSPVYTPPDTLPHSGHIKASVPSTFHTGSLPQMSKPHTGGTAAAPWKAACEQGVTEALESQGKTATEYDDFDYSSKNQWKSALVKHLQKAGLDGIDTYDIDYAVDNLVAVQTAKLIPPKFSKGGAQNKPNGAVPDESRPQLSLTEAVAAQKYTSSGYLALNQSLRNGTPLTPTSQEIHHGLSKAFAKVKPFATPVTVYRGMTLDAATIAIYQKALQTGQAVEQLAHSSTSTNPVSHFGGNVEMRIAARKGLDLKPYTHYPHESELLLEAGTKLKVVSITKDPHTGKHIMHMEQVLEGHPTHAPTPAPPPPPVPKPQPAPSYKAAPPPPPSYKAPAGAASTIPPPPLAPKAPVSPPPVYKTPAPKPAPKMQAPPPQPPPKPSPPPPTPPPPPKKGFFGTIGSMLFGE